MRAARADFTTLNYPGALFTFANGISGNTIVGSYSMGNRSAFGFIYNGGQYTSLMGPLASSSSATYPIPLAIDGKNIVGSWQDSAGIGHGFLYNGSNWTTLDFPGGRDTSPVGISGNTIIGTYYAGTSPSPSSFLYNGRTWTTFNVPGALSTSVNGIDGKNIVGTLLDNAGREHGFLYNGHSWAPIDVPGSTSTTPYAISGNTIVGSSSGPSGQFGFLYNGQTFTPLNVPGATWTDPLGVSGTSVIGIYDYPFAREYGNFLYTADAPEPSSLTLMALGVLAAAGYRWRSRAGKRTPAARQAR